MRAKRRSRQRGRVCLYPAGFARLGGHSMKCSDNSHAHIAMMRAERMVEMGEARWARHGRGRILIRYVSAREMRPTFAIRGASAKFGEWILSASMVHEVMRALIAQRKLRTADELP